MQACCAQYTERGRIGRAKNCYGTAATDSTESEGGGGIAFSLNIGSRMEHSLCNRALCSPAEAFQVVQLTVIQGQPAVAFAKLAPPHKLPVYQL